MIPDFTRDGGDRTTRISISMFQHTNLRIGAGEEKAILNYIKNVPGKKVSLTVYQTDFCPYSNLSEKDVNSYADEVKIITLKTVLSRFRFDSSGSNGRGHAAKYIEKVFYLFLKVIADPFVSRVVNRKSLQEYQGSDVAFIYDAEYAYLIPGTARKIPIVGTFRRDFGPHFRKDKLGNVILYLTYSCIVHRIDAFHFLTKRLFSDSPIHRNRDFVLSSGTDLEEYFPDPDLRKGPMKFIFVARLEEVKGVREAIESFERLGSVDAELYIAGSGTLEDYVRGKADSNDRIFFEGYLGKDDLASLYRKCDALIFPTKLSEQHPLIVVEAIASGLKVITSENLRGIFDHFEEEGVLEYISPDPDSLVPKLKECINNKEYLRENAYSYAERAKSYDWRVISEKLYTHLIEISKYYRN